MTLGPHNLAPDPGATHAKKRVGRGNGSGHGTYSGKGLKGQKSRSGKPTYRGFEGGQMPMHRKFKTLRGFNNKWRVAFQPVNVGLLERFDAGAEVTVETLRSAGIIKDLRQPVKILADGDLTRKLAVSAHAFSAGAREKIQNAGGSVTVLGASEGDAD
jgi:large subunit ribosomal protein L15